MERGFLLREVVEEEQFHFLGREELRWPQVEVGEQSRLLGVGEELLILEQVEEGLFRSPQEVEGEQHWRSRLTQRVVVEGQFHSQLGVVGERWHLVQRVVEVEWLSRCRLSQQLL